jgi:hypothetical protein
MKLSFTPDSLLQKNIALFVHSFPLSQTMLFEKGLNSFNSSKKRAT